MFAGEALKVYSQLFYLADKVDINYATTFNRVKLI
jgi:hypothetical protein